MTGVVCVQCCALTETLGAVSRRGCAAATVTVDGAEASVVGCCSVTADDWVLVDWGVRSCARCGAWSWADGRVSIPIRNSVLSRVHRDSTLVRARGGPAGRCVWCSRSTASRRHLASTRAFTLCCASEVRPTFAAPSHADTTASIGQRGAPATRAPVRMARRDETGRC